MLSWFHLDRLMFNLEFLTKTGNTVNVPVYNVRIFFSIWHLFNLRKNEWRLCKSVYVLFYGIRGSSLDHCLLLAILMWDMNSFLLVYSCEILKQMLQFGSAWYTAFRFIRF